MGRVVPSIEPSSSDDKTRVVVTTAAIIAALYFGSEIFVPITLAILLSFVLAPAVRLLQKAGLGRAPPVVIVVAFTVLLIAGMGTLIGAQIRDLANDLPRFEATMIGKIKAVRGLSDARGIQRVEEAVKRLTSALSAATPEAAGVTAGAGGAAPGPHAPAAAQDMSKPMPVQVVTPAMGPVDALMMVAGPLLHPLATAFIVLTFVVFILLQREDLRNRAIRLFGANDLQRSTAAINDGGKRLSRYFLTQCVVNACAGTVVAAALWLIGLPSPLLLGLLFACLRFVPYVGPIGGSLLPLLLATAVDPGWWMVAWTVGALLLVEAVVGQVVEPFAYGHNTGLSPIAIILAATFWTVLWGPVGLLLSTPITVCLVVLGRHVEQLAFLDVLLGDRPPLSPPEIFYQRMLANDPIEAADHAQRCLEGMSIAHYLDDVALPALILAQDDAAQDRIDLGRQSQIRDAALEVIEDLDAEHDQAPRAERLGFWRFARGGGKASREASVDDLIQDEPPAHLQGEGAVLCIGGRGPLDDAGAVMLAKVLGAYGIGARAESYGKLSKAEIGTLDLSAVRLICIGVLDGGSAAFLRFILRRLRRAAPQADILLGAWWRRQGPQPGDEEVDEAVRCAKVASFIDAVRFCLAHREAEEATTAPSQARLAAAS